MSEPHPSRGATVGKLALYCVLAGVLLAAMLFPLAGGAGIVVNHASDVAAQDSEQLMEGEVPTVSTMVDAAGNPIAWIYAQRRWPVPSDRIADTMKLAIVSIEDKRFADHNGVDVQGTLTGLVGYLRATSTPAAARRSSSNTSRTTTSWSTPRPTPSGGRRSRRRRRANCARSGWRWRWTGRSRNPRS